MSHVAAICCSPAARGRIVVGRVCDGAGSAASAQALRLKPDYARAIEYQGEAFLGLDRFEAAKFNYLRLYALEAEQAEKLLVAMRRWLDERKRDRRALSQDDIERASAWLVTRPSTAQSAHANESSPW